MNLKNYILKQHDKISCLCTFLYASIKIQALPTITSAKQQTPKLKQIGKSISKTSIQDIKSILFDLNDLKEAIQFAACKSYLRTLLNSLRIFLPVNYSIKHFLLKRKLAFVIFIKIVKRKSLIHWISSLVNKKCFDKIQDIKHFAKIDDLAFPNF